MDWIHYGLVEKGLKDKNIAHIHSSRPSHQQSVEFVYKPLSLYFLPLKCYWLSNYVMIYTFLVHKFGYLRNVLEPFITFLSN